MVKRAFSLLCLLALVGCGANNTLLSGLSNAGQWPLPAYMGCPTGLLQAGQIGLVAMPAVPVAPIPVPPAAR